MAISNPIVTTVDFEADGIQHGFLKLPHSDDSAAWGAVMIPITVIRNGEGPTALLTGANHGDEYEGPVALLDLSNTLRAEEIAGRIIIVPMMNYPAFRAGRRNSPIDQGNMNRVFPGKANGSATEKIADYFEKTLLPISDYVLDIHSGGKTLVFVPFAAAHILTDKTQQQACEAAMRAFSAPYSVMLLEQDATGMYDTSAENQGKVFVSTELGGGGSTTPATNGIARQGVLNFLSHARILSTTPIETDTTCVDMPSDDCYVIAEHSGLLELKVELGQKVAAGQEIARVYDVERTGVAPYCYHAKINGMLIGRHFPGLVKPGDTIAVSGVVR
jgi:N-alpha-acetyl-L-2,4-diaminobutyrate deacetylase